MDRKKIIIIISVIVLGLFLGLLLRFVFFKNKSVNQIVDFKKIIGTDKGLTYDDKIVPLLEKELESIEFQDRLIDGPLEVYEPITQDKCQLKQDTVGKENCYQRLQLFDILNQPNQQIKSCDVLTGKFAEYCIWELARQNQDWKLCEKLDNEKLKEHCIKSNTVINNNEDGCKSFEKESSQKACKDRVQALNNGSFFGEGIEGNILKCKSITTLEYFNQCVLGSLESCDLLEDKNLIDNCNSIRYFSNLVLTGKKENCEILPLEKYKKVCEIYFDNGKKFIDSDNDGLADNKELWFNTDPFSVSDEGIDPEYFAIINEDLNIDTDQDGLTDAKEAEMGTDPTINNFE